MCGIFGCIGEIDRKKAWECIERIQHRGPDAMCVEELQGVTLAHTRLSIIDVSEQANQPFCSEDKRYWIVFNGEIYNFVEIRKELELLGHKFRTQSDTEVVLHAYLQWGDSFQKKCNGMWAIAIWDDYEKQMFFSRDRFGVKPLYWHKNGENFFFASEMKAFLPIMKKRKMNSNLFYPYKEFGYETTEECVFEDVKRIQPGHCAIYRNGELHINRWWSTLDNLMEVPEEYEEQVEYLRELFLDAVKIRMRSDVPIGTALSGGLDSSSIVGTIHHLMSKGGEQRFCHDWQNAFVASMQGSFNDETKWAQMAAEHIGIDVKQVMVHAPLSAEELMRYIYMSEEPYNTALIPHFQIYEGIRENGIKVTIDGLGADEIFAGYPFDITRVIGRGDFSEQELWCLFEAYNNVALKENRLSLQDMKNMVGKGTFYYSQEKIMAEKGLDVMNQILYYETHEYTMPTILRTADRFSMASGVEARYPFLDYRIVGFAFSIPWTSKIRNGYTKAIERDMARPYMAESIIDRKDKIGFNDPLPMWFKGPLKEFLLDTVHSKDFIECGLVNSLEATVAIHEYVDGEDNTLGAAHMLWKYIGPYLWKKVMI